MVTNMKGEPTQRERCLVCQYGVMPQRTGRFGDFKSFSGFPRCKCKPDEQRRKGARQPKLTRRLSRYL